MKNVAFEYYTKSKLPEKVGSTEKLTLGEMLDKKLLIDFTDNGKVCSLDNSYIQATRTLEDNYALKVNLECGKKSDYILANIEKEKICVNNSCNNNTNNTVDNYKLDDEGKLVLIDNDTIPDIDKYFENKNINIDTSECIYKSKTHGISESVFNGIDISNYDGYVDFNAVKQSGVKAVYMKASESNYFIDQYAAENSINAKKAGLKVGYYHYLTGTSSPEEQARLFYNCIKDKPNDLKPCVDVESSPSTACDYTIRFINEFKKLSNMDVVVYTYSNFINNFDSMIVSIYIMGSKLQ